MGISLITAMFLARHAFRMKEAKRGLVLGRQKLHLNGRKLERFLESSAVQGLGLSKDDVIQPDGFTEKLFHALGYPNMEAMDFNDNEGSQHIHDLNRPVPAALKAKFDLVVDGGTTEHIFHIGQAIENCFAILKPGGVMMSFVACDGWFGHGFFQTGPDVPWRYWHHARGCEMLEVSIVPRKTPNRIRQIDDPTGKPRGGELFLEGPHMLLYACRKPLTPKPYKIPIQGHYVDEGEGPEA